MDSSNERPAKGSSKGPAESNKKKVRRAENRHDTLVKKADKYYEKRDERYNKSLERREEFLRRNDARLLSVKEKNDENIKKRRKRTDERLERNREKINERFVKGDKEKSRRLKERTEKTDRYIAEQRRLEDKRREAHRRKVAEKRKRHDDNVEKYYEERRIKDSNRLRKLKKDKDNKIINKKFKIIIGALVSIFLLLGIFEIIIPGSTLKRKDKLDKSVDESLLGGALSEKKYKKDENCREDKILWDALMKHFDGNETATLGVMCNLRAESKFNASNLEDYNNELWGIDDSEYTEYVNEKKIDRSDFAESRTNNVTNGYYNDYQQWVNKDGGYGYAQYTAYDKKDELYLFAEQWFGPGGEGDGYKFDISDPEMQASFILHLLESDQYKSMDAQIRAAGNVVDACYVWLRIYEIPYDPYNDNYYTLAFDRAEGANQIRANCQ